MARPLALMIAQRALVIMRLRGLLDVTSQGGELGEPLPTSTEVGLVLVLGGMSFQLVVGWK